MIWAVCAVRKGTSSGFGFEGLGVMLLRLNRRVEFGVGIVVGYGVPLLDYADFFLSRSLLPSLFSLTILPLPLPLPFYLSLST